MSISTVSPTTDATATLDDLAKVEGKAELIGGRIVRQMATGHLPNRVAIRIARSLDDHAEATGNGVAFTDSMGFAIPEFPSGRESFSPDASFYAGPPPEQPDAFRPGTADFRRRSHEANPITATRRLRRWPPNEPTTSWPARSVVWDVDPFAECVRKYELIHPINRLDSRGRAGRRGAGGARLADAGRPDVRLTDALLGFARDRLLGRLTGNRICTCADSVSERRASSG